MFISNMILGGIVIFLAYILFKHLGKASSKAPKMPDKLRFVSDKTGQIIEMRLIKDSFIESDTEEARQSKTIFKAKLIYQNICEAFAEGNAFRLKSYVDKEIFDTLNESIRERKEAGQKMDFALVCFDSVDIVDMSKDKKEVTVRFVTEQVNVLKDADGNVIEGDPMSIAKVTDLWTFQQTAKNKLFLTATQSEALYE